MAWTKSKRHQFVVFQEIANNSSNKTLSYDTDYAADPGANGPRANWGTLQVVSVRIKFVAGSGAVRTMGMSWETNAGFILQAYNWPTGHDVTGGTLRSIFTASDIPGSSSTAVLGASNPEGACVWGRMPPVFLGPGDNLKILDTAAVAATADDMSLWVHCRIISDT